MIVPAPPAVASAAYGTELVELYRASLLRDVAFTDYSTNATAIAAAAEMNSMPNHAGPKVGGVVTPAVLFRGAYPGKHDRPVHLRSCSLRPRHWSAGDQRAIDELRVGHRLHDRPDHMVQVENGIDTGLRTRWTAAALWLRRTRDGVVHSRGRRAPGVPDRTPGAQFAARAVESGAIRTFTRERKTASTPSGVRRSPCRWRDPAARALDAVWYEVGDSSSSSSGSREAVACTPARTEPEQHQCNLEQ